MKRETKPNLLILTSSFPSGPGDETCGYVRDFARALSGDFNVSVLAPQDKGAGEWPPDSFTLERPAPILPRAIDPLLACYDFNRLRDRRLLVKLAFAFSMLPFFLKSLRAGRKADCICSHWMVPCGMIGALISLLLGKPHVVVEHSGAAHLLSDVRGGALLARFILKNSFQLIAVSEDLRRKIVCLCPGLENRIGVIPMGVGIDRRELPVEFAEKARPERRRNDRILFIGRLTAIKGLDVLLRAVAGIEGAELLIAGDGEKRRELEGIANELSIAASFLGRVGAEERARLLAASDVVVIPSIILPGGRTEGTPLVCLEAMAAGRAVVASRAGGLAEIITDGYNGLLFQPGDHRMLSRRLKLILNDETLRQKISENARRTAMKYDWSRIGRRFGETIKSSLKSNGTTFHSQRLETENANG